MRRISSSLSDGGDLEIRVTFSPPVRDGTTSRYRIRSITSIQRHLLAGDDEVVDLLDRIEESVRFHIDSLTTTALATGKSFFRQHKSLSVVDACSVAYMHIEGLGYVSAFDDDFDAVEDGSRFDTATNPDDPNDDS